MMTFNVCTVCRLAIEAGETRCIRCGGALTLSDASVFVGELFGKYELHSVIGSGGMGVVFKAHHRALARSVAVKLLRPGLGDVALRERFLREARFLAGLRHPNIVLIHDFDVSDWGVPYYVMEHLEGHSLADEITRHPDGLSWGRMRTILHGAVEALAFAHARGIVHRDLKPDNIFIARGDDGEQIKLLDFGIARYLGESEGDNPRLTQIGFVVGTPLYFAPEQFYGYPVTLATDQFALALIVAEMLRGKPLRSGRSISEISREGLARSAADMATLLPEGLPIAATTALARALSADPAARFADVSAFVQALGLMRSSSAVPPRVAVGAMAETLPTPDPDVVPGQGSMPSARTFRAKVWPLLALVSVVVLAAIGWTHREKFAHPTSPAIGVAAEAAPIPNPQAWLRPRMDFSVPVDARGILIRSADVVVLESADGWYLRPLATGVEASRVVLPADQRLLGALQDGRLAVLAGDTLQAVDPLTREAKTLARLPTGVDSHVSVRIASDASAAVAWQGDVLVLFHPGSKAPPLRIAVPALTGSALALELSRHFLAIATGARVRVYRSSDGAPVLDETLDLGDVLDLALLDTPPRLALAGREPEVRLLSLDGSAPAQTIGVPRGASAVAWSADGPTLLLAGDAGLSAWRNQAFLPEHYANVALTPGALYVDGGGVLLLDGETHRLAWFDIGTLPIQSMHQTGTSEVWAVHVDAERGSVYVGARDGSVYALDGDRVTAHPLHSDGVTALAGDAAHLASASDDRTLAIWHLPDMTVQWRSRSHDYLINQIAIVGAMLWSSSSDGTLKSWRWPSLEEDQSLDLRTLGGDKGLRLHAFWIDSAQSHALVGTWNHRLVAMERRGTKWTVRSMPIESAGGYHLVELAQPNLVIVQGTQPTRLYAWDVQTQRLFAVPDLDNLYESLNADGSAGGVLAAGFGVVAHYVFDRAADGTLHVAINERSRSELGVLTAADFDAKRHRLWAADSNGRLFAFDQAQLFGQPVYRGVLMPVELP
ncbi:MAG: serine/threonine-protein kinase [Dokdonella sp.]